MKVSVVGALKFPVIFHEKLVDKPGRDRFDQVHRYRLETVLTM